MGSAIGGCVSKRRGCGRRDAAAGRRCASARWRGSADLLNLRRIRSLGAPVVVVGGAGTFDGVFLSGLLAVLLATL